MNQLFRALPIQLGESIILQNELNRKVQILRTGTFHHPEYGTFEITAETLLSMQKNFDSKVRGVDIAIDFAHESEKEAAAWIQALHISGDGNELWAEVIWTASGKESLMKKEYRYLSADFTFDYQDNESLLSFGPVLFGAGLTNRPVIKNMAPAIELSEGTSNMNNPVVKPAAPVQAAIPAVDPKDAKIAELEALVKELQAKCDQMGVDMAEAKKCADAEKAAKVLAEKTAKFNELMSAGKVVEAQRESFMSGDAMKMAELSQQIKLADQGTGATPVIIEEVKDAEAKVLELAEKMIANKEAKNLSEAVSKVLSNNSELAKSVRL